MVNAFLAFMKNAVLEFMREEIKLSTVMLQKPWKTFKKLHHIFCSFINKTLQNLKP